jgi:predicted RNase H-like HicB family nuclease
MTGHHYHINVFWSDEDQCWIASVPDLRPCSAHGETPREAVEQVQIAIEMWLDWAREKDIPIPEPLYKPAKLEDRAAA